ncbi:hypothetical protein C5S42_01370 [Candidatus Methanomarinus sp.]|nr:hypothetical protein C5S42_01370 [ANME-2 cluster archaeon]
MYPDDPGCLERAQPNHSSPKLPSGHMMYYHFVVALVAGDEKSVPERLPDEADLKPHQIRYWLTPSNDEDFDEKVRDISELYITAPERAKQGEQTLSTDEMTGVQALERKAPDLPLAVILLSLFFSNKIRYHIIFLY